MGAAATTPKGWGRPGPPHWQWAATGCPPPPVHARSEKATPVAAAVVFGDGGKRSLRRILREMDPDVEAAISAVYKIEAGAPRAVLYCAKQDIDMVLGILPTLRADGIGCAAYKEQRGAGRGREEHGVAPSKAKQAELGLRDASRRAGVCHYMTSGQECPHSLRGQCKFTCYDRQQGAQRRQPPDRQHSAQRRQPSSGWRR